jgi:Cu/Ag efflux pump CusA
MRYAWAWIKETTIEVFGPTWNTLQALKAGISISTAAACMMRVVLLPLVLVLYVLHLLLKAVSTTFVTVLFVLSVTVMIALYLLRIVFRIALWVPLQSFSVTFTTIKYAYSHALRVALQFGPVVLVIAGLLAVHAAFLTKKLGRELIPPLKQGEFGIRMEAPPGTRLEETEKLAKRIEDVVRAAPEIDTVGVEIGIEKTKARGERGENIAQLNVVLKNPEKMVQEQEAIMERLRHEIAAVSAEQVTFTLPTLFSFKTAVELQIRGDDLEELRRVGQRALEAVKDITLTNVKINGTLRNETISRR